MPGMSLIDFSHKKRLIAYMLPWVLLWCFFINMTTGKAPILQTSGFPLPLISLILCVTN